MLEKQFGLSSLQTGLLTTCNDIGYLSCVIRVNYMMFKWSNLYFHRRFLC